LLPAIWTDGALFSGADGVDAAASALVA